MEPFAFIKDVFNNLQKTRTLLRVLPPPIIELRCRRISMPGHLLHVLQAHSIIERCRDNPVYQAQPLL